MKQYLSRGIMNGEDLQDSLLALFAFFGLARSVEVINISREELKFKKKRECMLHHGAVREIESFE